MRKSTLKRDRKAVHQAALDVAWESVDEATLAVVNKYRQAAATGWALFALMSLCACICVFGWLFL